MIATLPLYDWPELRPATDRFWAGIRDSLHAHAVAAPDALDRDIALWDGWMDPGLVISQTCSLPYQRRLNHTVQLIGAPAFEIEDCPAGLYYSVIVTRRGDRRRAPRLAVNDAFSQSGWGALYAWLKMTGTAHDGVEITGAHRLSAQAVLAGQADIAAIDMQCWWLMQQHDAWIDGLEVIDKTVPTPAPPYIVPVGADAEIARSALQDGFNALPEADRKALNLVGIADVDPRHYLALPQPPNP